jgi:hypothetical protein
MVTDNDKPASEAAIRAEIASLEARERELNEFLAMDGCVTDYLRTELASVDSDLRHQVDLLGTFMKSIPKTLGTQHN